MTKLFIEDSSLTAIGDAIRAKTGGTELLSPSGMVDAIEGIETGGGGGGELPEEAFVFTGNMDYTFTNNKWKWFLDDYGHRITTKGISSASQTFANSTEITSIPFDFNFNGTTTGSYNSLKSMFFNCKKLEEIKGVIKGAKPTDLNGMFRDCKRLKEIPVFEDVDFSRIQTYGYTDTSYMFYGCGSLRSIPEDLMKQLYNSELKSAGYSPFTNGFYCCYSLDEIRGLSPRQAENVGITSNLFGQAFNGCNRVKNILFSVQEDGTPYVAKWKSQTIDLGEAVGFTPFTDFKYGYGALNTTITADKQVKTDADYAALKDDPDWFTADPKYSRYNHDSAVNTINSLPDTSAYLASAGGTNTVKFGGRAGANTDGGAINTLTEEEIAVAAAKGWTITYVQI